MSRMVALDPGRSGVGEYDIKGDEVFLKGHFPADPIFPGVLLLEAAAQLVGVVVQAGRGANILRGLKLTAVRQAKILGSARPGTTLVVRAEIVGILDNLVQATATVEGQGKRILETSIILSADERIQ